jgi:DNA-binding Lrp family transcriptional regulator
VPLYLGRITNTGIFIQVKTRKQREVVPQEISETAPEVDAGQKTLETAIREEKRYKHEPAILTALSMNGRIPMSVLGKIVGLKETAISLQVRKLEKRYGIKYLAEIDATKFGYTQFLVTVEFLDTMPKIDELQKILLGDARVQLGLIAKGDFNLAIYVLAKDSDEINAVVGKLRESIHHKSIWVTSPLQEGYGFVPLRTEFLDLIKDKLLVREYSILKELIINGNADFSGIDRKYNFDSGRAQYSFHKLKEQGIIKRITISMHNLSIRYVGIIIKTVIDRDMYIENYRERSLLDIAEDPGNNLNAYLLVDDIVSPDGVVLFMPVFNDGDLEHKIESMSDPNLGIRVKSLIISNILVGNFCFRKFDNTYSMQMDVLSEIYGLKIPQRIDYEETGRKKKESREYGRDIRGLKPELI